MICISRIRSRTIEIIKNIIKKNIKKKKKNPTQSISKIEDCIKNSRVGLLAQIENKKEKKKRKKKKED